MVKASSDTRQELRCAPSRCAPRRFASMRSEISSPLFLSRFHSAIPSSPPSSIFSASSLDIGMPQHYPSSAPLLHYLPSPGPRESEVHQLRQPQDYATLGPVNGCRICDSEVRRMAQSMGIDPAACEIWIPCAHGRMVTTVLVSVPRDRGAGASGALE